MRIGGLLLLMVLAASAGAKAADAGMCRFYPPDTHGAATDALARLVTRAEPTDQRGLGGTGVVAKLEERGLGGTGIVGIITGFGSVCVNGYEVGVTEDTRVNVAGVQAASGDLRLGQVVALEAYTDGQKLLAARINVRVAVAGPVEAIATDRTRFTVAGQQVVVAGFGGSADIAAVQVGDWVAVSGFRRADDTVAGSSIVRLPQRGREVFVTGMARATATGVAVGALQIESAAIAAGDNIAVVGELTGGHLAARDIKVENGSPFSRTMAVVSVQGFGSRVMDDLKRLGVAAGFTPPPDNGMPVQVDGRFGVAGTFTPERIETAPPPADGAIPRSAPADIPAAQPANAPQSPAPGGVPPSSPPPAQPTTPQPNAPQRPTPGPAFPQDIPRPDMTRPDRQPMDRNFPPPTSDRPPPRPEPPPR